MTPAITNAIAVYRTVPDLTRWTAWARTQVRLGKLTVEELAIASMAVQRIINEDQPQT